MVATAATILALASGPGHRPLARAGGLDDDRVNARAVARAGAVTASDDGGAALISSPAGLARRTVPRLSVGIAVRDFDGRHQFPDDGPRIDNQAPASGAPLLFAAAGGDSWVAALGYAEGSDRQVATAEPGFGQPGDQVQELFPHRYSGTRLRHQSQTLTLGGAARVGPWLALGGSLSASRVTYRQAQTLWAGFSGLADVGDPSRDLALELSGRDDFVPGAAVGLLALLGDSGVELSLGARISAGAGITGDASLTPTGPQAFPRVTRATDSAAVALPGQLTVRAGVRYAASRLAFEVGAGARWYEDEGAPTWQTDVAAQDQPALPEDPVGAVPGHLSFANHWEAAAAAEVAVVPSYLWLVGGYSYRARADRRRLSRLTSIDGALHSAGVGAEVYWREITIVAGYSRGWSAATNVAIDNTDVLLVNPFDGGTAPVGQGRFERTEDRFALSIEVAWDPFADGDPNLSAL